MNNFTACQLMSKQFWAVVGVLLYIPETSVRILLPVYWMLCTFCIFGKLEKTKKEKKY